MKQTSPLLAIDTNILVRFITQDDAEQTPRVNAWIETRPLGFIPDLVLAECYWVLVRAYHWKPSEALDAFDALLEVAHLQFDDVNAIAQANAQARAHAIDWADALILAKARQHQAQHLVTFDRKILKAEPLFAQEPRA